MAETIVARWNNAKHFPAHTYDAVKIDKDGQEFWAWANKGTDRRASVLYTRTQLAKWPQDDLTQVIDGKFGPPDWTLTTTNINTKVKVKETECVCSMAALWDGGCPSIRGETCKSKK